MNASEYRLKFSGSHVEIPNDFELGAAIGFEGEGEVVQKLQKDNADGTYIQVHVLRPKVVSLAALEGHLKEHVRTQFVSSSPSKRLRSRLYVYWQHQWSLKYPAFEKYYEAYIDKQIEKINEEDI